MLLLINVADDAEGFLRQTLSCRAQLFVWDVSVCAPLCHVCVHMGAALSLGSTP